MFQLIILLNYTLQYLTQYHSSDTFYIKTMIYDNVYRTVIVDWIKT